jgi:hypothetical protein
MLDVVHESIWLSWVSGLSEKNGNALISERSALLLGENYPFQKASFRVSAE